MMPHFFLIRVIALVPRTSVAQVGRFAEATDHGGQNTVTAAVIATNGTMRVDAAVTFEVTMMA